MAEPSNVRMVLASKSDVQRGLIGYVSFRLGLVEIDGATLRRTQSGVLTLSYPSRRDRNGREHPYLRPRSDEARRQIEHTVFDALGLQPGAS